MTGIRASLASSLQNKRDASQIVDSISAEDVGKFPDANIAESLQRITGVAIDRSGGEGRSITVRGLGPEFNTVLVNGRLMATDNPGRDFSFDVLSSTLIQRADVFKTSTANLQEGGIGATVNIVTARPLDSGKTGVHFASSAGGIYDTLTRKTSPDISATGSYVNEAETFGIVLSGSFTRRPYQDDFIGIDGWPFARQHVITTTGGTVSQQALSANPFYVPQNVNLTRLTGRNTRINAGGTVQWRPSDTVQITLDSLYSKFDSTRLRRTFAAFYSPPFLDVDIDDTGTAISFTRPGPDFVAAHPQLTAAGQPAIANPQNDNIIEYNDRFTESYLFGGNVRWSPTEAIELRLDAAITGADQDNPSSFVVVGSQPRTSPRFQLGEVGAVPAIADYGDTTDLNAIRAHYTNVGQRFIKDRGEEFHFDSDWKVDDAITKSIQFGLTYSNRTKSRVELANTDADCAYCGYEVPIDPGLLEVFTPDRFLSRVSGRDGLPAAWVAGDPRAIVAFLGQASTLAVARQGRTAEQQAAEAARLLALPGGPYGLRTRPSFPLSVRERTTGGYFNFILGGERWSGNAGVRVVRTDLVSRGFDTPVTNVFQAPGDVLVQFTYGPSAPVSVSNSYVNALPSANIRFDVSRNLSARAAFSQTLTRPTLTSLGVDNSYGGFAARPTSGGGNPGLLPFRSTNYDASVEWYLSRLSYVSIGAFYKNLSNFLEDQTIPVARFRNFIPDLPDFQDTRTRNGLTGNIRGIEIGSQYVIDFTDSWVSGFGAAGNYTYVASKANRIVVPGSINVQCGYNGLSPHSANGSLFYEKFGLSARVSYNWRSEYLRACRSDQGQPRNRKAYGQWDVSLAYDLTPNFSIYAQGVNVTSAYTNDFSVIEQRFLNVENTGARYNFGIRAKF